MTAVDERDRDTLVVDLTAGADPTPTAAPAPGVTTDGRSTSRPTVGTVFTVVLFSMAVLAAWFVLYATFLSGLQERASQSRLYGQFRSELANETAPLGGSIGLGRPVALLGAPVGGLGRVVVVEGSTSHQLLAGAGHLPSSPLPGQVGDAVIIGRSLTFGAPFAHLTNLKPGNRITVTTGQGVSTYQVEDVRYPGDSLPPALEAGQARLTLVTASHMSWIGAWTSTRAVYVDALLVRGHAQPVPAALPKAGRSSLPMQDDPHALVALIFWLEALGVAVFGVIWAWRRWGRTQTWLVGGPLLLAIIWGATSTLARFLPNLI